ncbi:MAG: preprotein translocase subunit SecY [Candidatus Sumerlaeia bacterium]|nr:preprotein translocase subunit SecY [Candidatus Sumerlaeia bacterium]
MISSLLTIPKIPDLWRRVKYTLLLIAIYRVVAAVPSPFIDLGELRDIMHGALGDRGLLQFVNLFSGGAFEQMTVVALGIMPYITASIIIQLLGFVVPSIERMMKEGEAGKKKINDWTRYSTVGICLVQSIGIAVWLRGMGLSAIPGHPVFFTLFVVVALTTGTLFLMWLGEKISENGIGNGISLIITVGILASYPASAAFAFTSWQGGTLPFAWIIGIALLSIAVTVVIILIQQGQRKIPVQHAKRMMGRRMVQAQTTYLPLRINTAGVIPVIFSGSILSFPAVFGFFGANQAGGGGFWNWMANFFDPYSNINLYSGLESWFDWQPGGAMLLFKSFNMYTFLYAALTIAFCFFYTAIVFNPVDVADNLKKVGAFIPGRRPGKPTSDFIDYVLLRITVVGAIFLTSVALIPQILSHSFGVDWRIAQIAGGTGLIINVGVILDTMRQIESHLLQRHYDGFMKRGRLKGRY